MLFRPLRTHQSPSQGETAGQLKAGALGRSVSIGEHLGLLPQAAGNVQDTLGRELQNEDHSGSTHFARTSNRSVFRPPSGANY